MTLHIRTHIDNDNGVKSVRDIESLEVGCVLLFFFFFFFSGIGCCIEARDNALYYSTKIYNQRE